MQSVRRKSREKDLLQTAKKLISALPVSYSNVPRQLVGVLAVLTLCSILVAGLWPFHSPKNQVHWLQNENGLQFAHYGTILSTGILERAGSDRPSSSIEFWMAPASAWNTGTLIAFYSPLASRQFSLRQRYTDLELQLDIGGQHPQRSLAEMRVHDVFRKKQALVTVTSDGQETAVYLDGQFVTRSEPQRPCYGHLGRARDGSLRRRSVGNKFAVVPTFRRRFDGKTYRWYVCFSGR